MSEDSSPRAKRVEVKVSVERAETMPAGSYEALNISKSGICLKAPVPEQIGGFVALRFPLGGAQVNVYAEVIWCNPDPSAGPSAYRIGMRFVVLGQREQQVIEEFVDEQTGAGAGEPA
jgi:hypothetical protein